jgi:hypothetical protein
MAIQNSYVPLESELVSSLGPKLTFSTTDTPALFTSTSFIYSFAFVIIIVTASFRYALAGVLRMQASEEGIRKSKEEFKRVTFGLLGVLGLWLILFTVNKDMLTGEVGLENLKTDPIKATSNSSGITTGGNGGTTGGGNTNTGNTGGSSGTSASCNNVDAVKAAVQPGGAGICANVTCSLTSCINNNEHVPLIKSIAGSDWKMALVLMCKESSGRADAQNVNPNGTYDCGLMQVNQATPCDASILDPRKNITAGVAKLREKMNASSNAQQYPNLQVRPETAIFTAYNCCANGTVPNSPSVSCKTSDGWPNIPKWACPIDPGEGKFNMCGVKAYACDLTACLNSL